MPVIAKFKNATDFRKSLEARLQRLAAKNNVDLQRLRRKVAFDRFLARIFSEGNPGFFLKVGNICCCRLHSDRVTSMINK